MARPLLVGRLRILAVAAGTLLAILTITLTLWSTNLLKKQHYTDCLRHAATLTAALDVDLRQCLRQVADLGTRPAEVQAVWWVGADEISRRDPPDAPDPPAHLLDSARSFRGDLPLPLSSDDGAIAATWVPRSSGDGLLVQWSVEQVAARLLRRLEQSPPDYRAALLEPGDAYTRDKLGFHAKGFSRAAPPFAFWRIAVGLRDGGATRSLLRLQAWLLGLLAVWLLVVLSGSIALNARAHRALAERQEARNRFLARATHELQTPLALIRAAAETIQRGAADRPQDVARCADIMVREEERLTRTIRRLLRTLRLEGAQDHGGQALDQVSLTAEVTRTVEDDRGTLQAQGIALELALDEVDLQTPRGLMADAVSELLANTRRYATGASKASVRLERNKAGARLTVEDDGPGLTEAMRARLFQPWTGPTPGQESSGLGLALIREGLAHVGGTITCDGDAPGARFVIEIPRRS